MTLNYSNQSMRQKNCTTPWRWIRKEKTSNELKETSDWKAAMLQAIHNAYQRPVVIPKSFVFNKVYCY